MSDVGYEMARSVRDVGSKIYRLARFGRKVDTTALIICVGLLCLGTGSRGVTVYFLVSAIADWVVSWRLSPRLRARRACGPPGPTPAAGRKVDAEGVCGG